MSFWGLMNWVAYGVSALIFIWIIRDFMNIEREYDEEIILGLEDYDEGAELLCKEGALNE